MFIIFIICLLKAAEITKTELDEVNYMQTVDWKPYIPTQAFSQAITSQGCVLPKESVPFLNATFTPTRVIPSVDTSKQTISSPDKTYAEFGTIDVNNNLLKYQVDFTTNYQNKLVYGTLYTQPLSMNYSVWVHQNNKTIAYKLYECPNMTMDFTITQVNLEGLTEVQKMEVVNAMNSIKFLNPMINQYYEDHSEKFCSKLKLFVSEKLISNKISFTMFEFYQFDDPNPKIIESIENIIFQGLNFNDQNYVLGLNVEIFNYQTEFTTPLDVHQIKLNTYSFGISMDLLKSYFNYGAENGMFDVTITNNNFPIEGFSYKTGDLRTMIPSAYYSFKLNTELIVQCKLITHSFIGLTDLAVINNSISVQLGHHCQVITQGTLITGFDIDVEMKLAIKEFSEYIDFFIKEYRLLLLKFQEAPNYGIWSLKNLESIIQTGLEQNLIGKNVYGSGWLKNQLGPQISYGFSSQTLAIWNAQLI
ncbi:unnamed protein product [Paramecium octaurelia]|uniref:Uncharacterized protein n=1 Tax=Paramecium octaurelia TaxID=43137 RepID=A0A8S1XBI0_PAROT|nr:unnamed protein product [Paramecium octaurelia]